MRSFRRALAWMAILGLVITGVVMLQRRDHGSAAVRREDDLAARAAVGARQSIDAMHRDSPAAETFVESGDEAELKCARTLDSATEFVTAERNAASPEQASELGEAQWAAELASAQRALASSRDSEHLLAAVLLDRLLLQDSAEQLRWMDPKAQTKLFDLADRATRSGSKLLAWHALHACVAAKQSCPVTHLEQRLLEADRQNAEAWALVATRRYERGDVAGALAAMQGAARAPTSTWYWAETTASIERSLAAQTAMNFRTRMMVATGAGSAALHYGADQHRMCTAESASSREWSEACLAFAKLRAERNETDLAQSTGYIVREQVFTALGEREHAAEAASKLALVRAERYSWSRQQESGRSIGQLKQALIETDPGRLYAYLSAIQQHGEWAGARVFLRQELPPLLERAGLLGRDGARECAAGFLAGTRPAAAGQQVRAADQLFISASGLDRPSPRLLRVGSGGQIVLGSKPKREIMAIGKTTAELQREIAMTVPAYSRSSDVQVVLLSRRSDEELRLEFDSARSESEARRSNAR